MLNNVKYYKMLSNDDLLKSSGVSNKAIAYFLMNNIAEYNHDKALFYKLLVMKDKNKLNTDVFDILVESAFKFILTFQSVCSRESKTTLSVFVEVQNEIYKVISHFDDKTDLSNIKFSDIICIFDKYISNNAISDDTLRKSIKTNLTYTNNKKAVKVILSFLEYQDDKGSVDYTKLYWLLKAGKDIQIDHILPLNPQKNDGAFKYFMDGESVVLKTGQDFVPNNNSTTISKDDFYESFLHVIGNLRLEWARDNIIKSNHFISIKEFDSSFNSNSQISTRSLSLINQILNSGLLYSATNIKATSVSNDISNETIEISAFDKNSKYELFKPISFEFLGEKYLLEKANYSQLLVTFIRIMFNLESEKFVNLAESKYKPMTSERIYISNNEHDIRKPIVLADSVYAETNLSSEYIIKFIYALIGEFELNTNDMVISLNKTK